MSSGSFYRDSAQELCQGDIIRELPHLHLKPPLQAIREVTLKGRQHAIKLFQMGIGDQPPGGLDFAKGEQVSAYCQLGFGIILSHGCDIDNDPKHRLVALVRPLGPVPPEHQGVIRENRNHSYCYLPPVGSMGESYVDFRRITCIAPVFLDSLPKEASLTEESLAALQAKLFMFFTRREIGREMPEADPA